MPITLNDRQERFVLEYLHDQNASAAAARAGYTAKNMAQQGCELMSNPAIRDRVRVEMQNVLADLRASALALMKQRARAAFFDPGKLFASGWEPLPLDELDAETRAVVEVSTVLRKSGPVVRVKQPDRHRALRALEKAHEKLEQLNERYYRQLEREGRVPTLEEIEAMDQGGVEMEEPIGAPSLVPVFVPVVEMEEKPWVLSGGGECPPTANAEKGRVLSGSPSAPGADALAGWGLAEPLPASAMVQKNQVLSGGAPAPDANGEKHRVLSGAASRPPEENAEKSRVLSGRVELAEAAPRGEAPLSSAPGPWPEGHGTLRRAGLRA